MEKNKKYDVCVVGSGAGAGPIIYELSKAGFQVLVLEKGPWIKTNQFSKDEMVACRKTVYTPNLKDEFHILESQNKDGVWEEKSTKDSGKDYWNGNCVGGSSNFMSAYFHRLKPKDFKLLSEYGEIEGANIVDWPISYEELEPYYTKVEQVVGVSGEFRHHSTQETRSTIEFPFPPLQTNKIANWLDDAAKKEGYNLVHIPRGIISLPKKANVEGGYDRNSCYYSNFCGSFGCSSDAKSSSRVALIEDALATGNCTIITEAKVFHLETNGNNKIIKAHFHLNGNKEFVEANQFVVACQAVETSRLLLSSINKDTPKGIGNENDLVGKNLIFSGGGIGSGILDFKDFSEEQVNDLRTPGLFINRAIQHWYEINDGEFGEKAKGGTIDFIFEHPNPMPKLIKQKVKNGKLIYGSELKKNIHQYFTEQKKIKFEIFNDWLPNDNCFVSLSSSEKDKFGDFVAKIRIGNHQHDLKVAKYLAKKGEKLLENIGAKNVSTGISSAPSPNLQAGGCRFGNNPKNSVLDKNCKVHSISNLYITDASFMPTGGSVPYTFTIYANSFRVADFLLKNI